MAEEVRPRAPLFFLSYAHSRGRERITRYFNDLTENVSQLVGWPVGADPGFMDSRIPDGNRWSPELLGAVGRCQVFVAMLSGLYANSPWCGKEWFAFTRRRVTATTDNGAGNRTCIVPVIWAPVAPARLPPVVRERQWFMPGGLTDPAVAEQYETDGLFGMLATGHEIPYQTVVWELAKHIRDIYYSSHVEPLVLREDQLHDAFREAGS